MIKRSVLIIMVFLISPSINGMNFKIVGDISKKEYPFIGSAEENQISALSKQPADGIVVRFRVKVTKGDSKKEYFLQVLKEQRYTKTPGRNIGAIRGSVFPVHPKNILVSTEEEPISVTCLSELFNTLSILYHKLHLIQDLPLLKAQPEPRE